MAICRKEVPCGVADDSSYASPQFRVFGRMSGFPLNSVFLIDSNSLLFPFLSLDFFQNAHHGEVSRYCALSLPCVHVTSAHLISRSSHADGSLAQPSPKITSSSAQSVISRNICGRISQWLWSGWWGTGCEPASNPHATRQPYQKDPLDCKACREWGVACDHTRPQCAHCYDQQILCFYVNRNEKVKRKAKPVEAPILRPVRPPDARSRVQETTR